MTTIVLFSHTRRTYILSLNNQLESLFKLTYNIQQHGATYSLSKLKLLKLNAKYKTLHYNKTKLSSIRDMNWTTHRNKDNKKKDSSTYVRYKAPRK